MKFETVPDLKPATREWRDAYFALLNQEPWLRNKLDRPRRLRELNKYMDRTAPELLAASQFGRFGLVVDVGPGPGDYLEIAREHGWEVLGVESSHGAGGMGDQYLAACRMMLDRQEVPCIFDGLMGFLFQLDSLSIVGVRIINMRGSIEQCFSDFMVGTPHHVHRKANQLSWRIDERLRCALKLMLVSFRDSLCLKGSLVIHANGARNSAEWADIMRELSEEVRFPITMDEEGGLLTKWTVLD